MGQHTSTTTASTTTTTSLSLLVSGSSGHLCIHYNISKYVHVYISYNYQAEGKAHSGTTTIASHSQGSIHGN